MDAFQRKAYLAQLRKTLPDIAVVRVELFYHATDINSSEKDIADWELQLSLPQKPVTTVYTAQNVIPQRAVGFSEAYATAPELNAIVQAEGVDQIVETYSLSKKLCLALFSEALGCFREQVFSRITEDSGIRQLQPQKTHQLTVRFKFHENAPQPIQIVFCGNVGWQENLTARYDP